MVMQTLQIRLTQELMTELNMLVEAGIYGSISEAARDAVRRLVTGREAPIKNLPQPITKKAEKAIEKIDKELKKQFQKPKGTEDFFPEDMAVRKAIFRKLMKTAENYNFKQIEAPAFEYLDLLTKKEGEEITKQIFVLEQRSDERFGLRFDITVSATRMFIEKQKELPKPVKWFYLTRMWRYERPQAGRLREFYQYGTELFGSNKPQADAEIISLLIDSLCSLGLTEKDFFVKINNRKLLEGLLKGFIEKNDVFDIISIIDKKSKITEEEFDKELEKINLNENDIIRIKKIINIKSIDEIKKLRLNELAKQGLEEIESIFNLLESKKDFIKLDLSTARGLAYYTGTVFEAFDKEEKFRALAGGGRYDRMVEMFNGEPTPATGFGMGYSTVTLLLKEKGLIPNIDLSPDYYIVVIGDVRKEAMALATRLRKESKVEIDLSGRNVGNQFKYANSIGAKKVIVVGENELEEGKFTVKDMGSGKEEKINL